MPNIRYTGLQQRPEVAITGIGTVWFPGESRNVEDATRAGQLLRAGMGWEVLRESDVPGPLTPGEVAAVRQYPWQVHPRYFCHLFAGNQLPDDSVVYDISGAGSHAQRGASLSVAQLWATPGYASTLDPSGGTPDTKLILPALNFDYLAGEKLLIWWLGKATAEGAATNLLGDNRGIAGQNGLRLRVSATGQIGVTLNEGATNIAASVLTTLLPCTGELSSFGVFVDGQSRTYATWVNETAQIQGSSLASGIAVDTRSTVPLYLGGDNLSTGLITATRALAIIRLSGSDAAPSLAQLIAAQRTLRSAPQLPLRVGAL